MEQIIVIHPVRPPRRQKQSDYGYSSLSRQAMDRNYSDRQYNSLRYGTRS